MLIMVISKSWDYRSCPPNFHLYFLIYMNIYVILKNTVHYINS